MDLSFFSNQIQIDEFEKQNSLVFTGCVASLIIGDNIHIFVLCMTNSFLNLLFLVHGL